MTGHDLDIIGIIGIVLLIGIVKKNAIMMIDFAIAAERDEGLPPVRGDPPGGDPALPPDPDDDAGGAVRGRSADGWAWGEGAELRRPLGIAIFGGLLVSQLLTMFTTPIIYLYFDARSSVSPGAAGA